MMNNPEFENYLGQMYPAELEIKNTTENIISASYLDSLLSIGRDWIGRDWTSHFQAKTEVPRDVRNSKVQKQDKFRIYWSQH